MSQIISKEYETKVLDINTQEIEKLLKSLGAEEFPEIFMRRCVFDFINDSGKIIRVRSDGNSTTLTYKFRLNTKIDGTEEIEVQVDDFEKTVEIFEKLTSTKYYQENKRKIYRLGNIEFSIDTWPLVPTFLEIEANSVEEVIKGLKLLKLEKKDSGNIDHINIYRRYGIDLHSYKELKF